MTGLKPDRSEVVEDHALLEIRRCTVYETNSRLLSLEAGVSRGWCPSRLVSLEAGVSHASRMKLPKRLAYGDLSWTHFMHVR
jgi:hypothetical protein